LFQLCSLITTGAIVTRRLVLPVLEPRGSRSRTTFPSRSCLRLEQSTLRGPYEFSAVTERLLFPAAPYLTFCCACDVNYFAITEHNRFCYLLINLRTQGSANSKPWSSIEYRLMSDLRPWIKAFITYRCEGRTTVPGIWQRGVIRHDRTWPL